MRTLAIALALFGCSKAAGPSAATREAAARQLSTQTGRVTFTTRGDAKDILVVHYPQTTAEPCEPKSLEALSRMEPDPARTRDANAPQAGLADTFKQEITPEMKAQMETIRKLVHQFRRIECETKAGATIGIDIAG